MKNQKQVEFVWIKKSMWQLAHFNKNSNNKWKRY